MKGNRCLPALLLGLSSITALAQNKNSLYADVGTNLRSASVTYNRSLTRHFDVGAGIGARLQKMGRIRHRVAAYVDLRPHWAIGRSTIFLLIDVGACYKTEEKKDSFWVTPVGFYSALGVGYHYRINKKGMGPYITAGMYGDYSSFHTSRTIYPESMRHWSVFDASGILSLGFRF